jgi:putative hemolysin
MKRAVILDETDLVRNSPALKGKFGLRIAKIILKILALDRLNEVYAKCYHLDGHHFTAAWLEIVGVSYTIGHAERLEQLPQGAFITVSNHVFGGLDGIIMVDIMARQRSDYKFMVNTILMNVKALSENFIGVKPITPKSGSSVENVAGLKQTLRHLQANHPMGFFPAGAVSVLNSRTFKVTDRDWQPTVIRLIQAAKVPVIPIYVEGKNSWFFNLLGRVNWQLRSFRLPYEILNKRGKVIKVIIGEPISWEEQQKYTKIEDLAAFLKAKTYELS